MHIFNVKEIPNLIYTSALTISSFELLTLPTAPLCLQLTWLEVGTLSLPTRLPAIPFHFPPSQCLTLLLIRRRFLFLIIAVFLVFCLPHSSPHRLTINPKFYILNSERALKLNNFASSTAQMPVCVCSPRHWFWFWPNLLNELA